MDTLTLSVRGSRERAANGRSGARMDIDIATSGADAMNEFAVPPGHSFFNWLQAAPGKSTSNFVFSEKRDSFGILRSATTLGPN
eukprot:941184-Amphidinium_carterae.1